MAFPGLHGASRAAARGHRQPRGRERRARALSAASLWKAGAGRAQLGDEVKDVLGVGYTMCNISTVYNIYIYIHKIYIQRIPNYIARI